MILVYGSYLGRMREIGLPSFDSLAEPASFWKPKDKYNERWLELKQKPTRYRDPAKVPSFESIFAEQHDVFEKHPNTTHQCTFGLDGKRFTTFRRTFGPLP